MTAMSLFAPAAHATTLHEIRRYQVYRLQRPRQRPLLQRLRRTLRARFAR